MTRASWDEVWMATADAAALRTGCERGGVGAVIVTPDNQVCATGYTGPPAGLRRTCAGDCPRFLKGPADPLSYADCISIHAELNAFLRSERARHLGGTIYVTSNPCWDCSKVIANSGVARIVTRVNAPHRDWSRCAGLLIASGLKVVEWRG